MRQRAVVLLRDLPGLPDLTHHSAMTEYVAAGEGSPAAAGPVHHLQRLRLCGAQEAGQVMVNGGERTNGEEAAQCEPADGDGHADRHGHADRDEGVCIGDSGHDSTHS